MTCPVTVRLGVYALGAADAAERILVETHLLTCRACQAELAHLQPLPVLLARVPADLLRADPAPAKSRGGAPITRTGNTRAGKARSSAGRWRSVAGVVAAAAVGVAGGLWLAPQGASQPGANSPPAGVTLSGANPATHVRVTVTLTGTSWGTSIRLLAQGLPLNQPCRLIVRSRTGGTEVAGVWDAWRAGPISVPASVGWRLADIASLQVATTSRSLVTVTPAQPTASVPPSSRPNRARP
ncbi:MAG TPA: zf-HC2 domain-containing protein [Streptosporangiaceae bacterium]|jgi:anti-sigma factor RsiW|nr:zf-HC2 domain-containing protein [Streptosporangiaceae bacterium]